MPAWASDSVNKIWGSSPGNGSDGTTGSPPSPASPGSPLCGSPPLLHRHSSGYLSEGRSTPSPPPELSEDSWINYILLHFIPNLVGAVFYLVWTQVILFGPTLWFSAWLWCLGKLILMPLNMTKWVLTVLTTPASERLRRKRTVLISGGSTIQTIHLARNFHSAGARVVVFDVQGSFGLARFSTAVDKYYTVPSPFGDRADKYVAAVKRIVEEERAVYYIPVSSSSTAYHDALVKPHVELMGCTCFCPGLKEVCVLDDVFEVMRRCHAEGMATPLHYPITSTDDVYRLYEKGTLCSGRHVMINVGPLGCRDRVRIVLPQKVQDFKMRHEVSQQRPWVIVRDYPGDHFVTCTTVKDSAVVANVTCKVDAVQGGLTPVNHHEINLWIKQFFAKLKFLRPLTGHISFRFVVSSASGSIVPLGCKVGVSMPYICHTSVHPRMIWKPCRHFNPQSPGPLISEVGRYWMHQVVMDTLRSPGLNSFRRFLSTLLNKQEALFVYWDPLPYFAYYHIQLPITNICRFLRGHRTIDNGGHGFRRVAGVR
ncbi:uncharacterized protein LOC128988692 [Macrosteles quadrilineatus]|uniref:uncharacterized protein LOC128988692 n=1 Tax=Macrosteles quadrilineatus TaxID=74068 RepID=UPI0023E25A24|nr:uncharacterized protein LOC128988692 [Macrosteles quadrilineatus]